MRVVDVRRRARAPTVYGAIGHLRV
jgi:hypothetical protein